jgi:serine/threonine protein phosphatase 1
VKKKKKQLKSKRWVLGDIHGRLDYLLDVLQKSGFDYENDLLIQIGDVVDRGPDPFKCIDELMKIKNRIFIIGNHDASFLSYVSTGRDLMGFGNGTIETIEAWKELDKEEQFTYLDTFFREQKGYHLTDDGFLFVHGGFPDDEDLEDVPIQVLCWDRELIAKAMACKEGEKVKTKYEFKDIYVGHTPTIYWDKIEPIYSGGVWNIDTGSGKGGPLTIMNIDTNEYFQSTLSLIDENKLKAYGLIKKIESTKGEEAEEAGS